MSSKSSQASRSTPTMSSLLNSSVAQACNEAAADSEGNSTKGGKKQKMDFTQGYMEVKREELQFNRQKYADAMNSTKNEQKFTMTLKLIEQGKTPEEIEAYLRLMNF